MTCNNSDPPKTQIKENQEVGPVEDDVNAELVIWLSATAKFDGLVQAEAVAAAEQVGVVDWWAGFCSLQEKWF